MRWCNSVRLCWDVVGRGTGHAAEAAQPAVGARGGAAHHNVVCRDVVLVQHANGCLNLPLGLGVLLRGRECNAMRQRKHNCKLRLQADCKALHSTCSCKHGVTPC